ncbi:MAG: serine/threonine protein kinase [Planctomycetaceae bacterium]|jgi:hypothetical protein|nr:serine/threonine protein kinase [Planctomycetaceae bacterium]MBT6154510.1 serine/threonine protein kinase [Planctomycetaceae bacterium]MBT6486540.1 serine/threonine protein kinase [Planctomycetaceae bacterium]MBT6496976.1 serine/threonine protein kinase [Planctomycetaceae bacterium]
MQPTRIGPYSIDRKIGAGGMGTVYLAHHVESGQQAAVKVLSSSLAGESGLVARFSREIDALTELSNPHVIEIYESGVDEQTYYFAMEYVDGETIADRLKREKRIEWETVIELSVQICTALKAAHDAGIIHRDLKPSNLLVTGDDQIKLADFGIAQIFAGQKLTMTGGILGTAEFMSPEQAQGQRATKKSDLYSLGAVMYAMLTGRPPFTGKTAVEVLQKHRFNQFDAPRLILPDIPIWLDDVVCQLLEKDPDKRFPDAYVLSLRLKEIPRKVELAGLQETRTAAPVVYNADGTTVAISSQPELGPGDGTLMRDLLRAEIDRQQQPSRVGRLLDNSWFLVAVLVVLIAGGYYALQPAELTPQQKFSAGEKLMQHPAGADWMTARDEFFLPLVADDPLAWEAKVAVHLEQIQQYELELRLSPGKLKKKREPARNDAERFLRLAQHYREIGDVGRSRNILTSLTELLDEQGEHQLYRDQAQKMLAELDGTTPSTDNRGEILKSAMQRADEFANADKPNEARAIYESIIALYGSDPAVADEVRIAIEKRDQLVNLTQPSPPADN